MTKEILEYFSKRRHFIPDAQLTKVQRNTMIQLEQKGIVHSSNESFLGGAPEIFWFVNKAKLDALNYTERPPTPKPPPKRKTRAKPKLVPKRRRRKTKSKDITLQLPIKKWEMALVIISFLIILFS